MKKLKVVRVWSDGLAFEDGYELSSYHKTSCCESHYLSLSDLELSDFDGLEFDLSNDDFLEKIEGYGIALKPINNFPVRIPGYGRNNGWYSTNLFLLLTQNGEKIKVFDITECQVINDPNEEN